MTDELTEEAKLLLAIALLEYDINTELSPTRYETLIKWLEKPDGLDHVLYWLSLNTEHSGKIPPPKGFKNL